MTEKNKNSIKIGVVFCLVCLFVFFLITFSIEEERVETGFTIEKYDVVLDVKEDNKIDVTENITVNFINNRHGLFRFVPRWLKYTSKDGKTHQRKSKVMNLRAENDNYILDKVDGKDRIRIGNINEYENLGYRNYTIKYTYDMGKDPYKGFDEFIFHAFGDFWGTELKNPSIEVHMPKSIEGYKVNFFSDKYRNENVTNAVEYQVVGNTLYARYNKLENYNKPLLKSLTVDIELPENYFVGGSNNYGYISLIISFICIGITVYTYFIWYSHGKDHQKRAETVEFYPPEGLSPAEIGYIYNDNQPSRKNTISLIIELASKGYIKIDEIENKKIKITSTVSKPIEPVENKDLLSREIKINKAKDSDDNLTSSEKVMMDYLFKDGNEKVLSSNIDKFLEVRDGLIEKGYIVVLDDNEKLIKKQKETVEKYYKEQLQKYNNDNEEYLNKIKNMPELSEVEQVVYDALFEKENSVILSEHETFYTVFSKVDYLVEKSLKDKVKDKDTIKYTLWAAIGTMIIFVLSILSYSFIKDMNPTFVVLYYIAFACIFISLLFTLFMNRKTEYGEEISARVKGFKNFLETAEKENLESLVNKNPYYFYDILPYTYVLNVSKEWIKKFENIKIPEMDTGSFNYLTDSYDYINSNISYPSSSSGGCGGGCSSCGGGCSSCGGGGSW